MNSINTALETGFLFFLDLFIRTTVVLIIAAGAAWLLRGQAASRRRSVWVAGLIVVIAMPVLMTLGPRISVAIDRGETATTKPTDVAMPAASAGNPIRLAPQPKVRIPSERQVAAVPAASAPLAAAKSVPIESTQENAVVRSARLSWYAIPVGFVVLGAMLRFAYLAVSAWNVHRLLLRTQAETCSEWERDWADCCRQMGVRSGVVLRRTEYDVAPMACGIFQPTVILPQAADGWSSDRRRAVMLHELAHVRQRDVAVILLGQIVCALYFFHPLAWFAARRLRHECERTCDDLVLQAGGHSPADYAAHLTAIARTLVRTQHLTALAMAMVPTSSLKQRITAILDGGLNRSVPGHGHTVACIAVALGAGLTVASPQLVSQEPSRDDSSASGLIQDVGGATVLTHQQHRNNAFDADVAPVDWDVASGKNVLWTAKLGSQTAASPVVADGKIFIGTNNGGARLKRFPGDHDLGCLLAFDSDTGNFLWQYSAEKLPTGRTNDWPQAGITASAYADGDRVWVVNNRSEIVCLDTEGFHDNEDDGRVDFAATGPDEADVVWSLDLMNQLGTFPHNHSDCRLTSDGRLLFVVVPNGVDASHQHLPKPSAPAFIAVDRVSGKVVWTSSVRCEDVMHAQWSSAALARVNGRTQVICPGGNGWIYGLDAATGETIWKFDCNPRDAVWQRGGRSRRNNVIGMPLVYDGLVYIATGQDPEHGEGQGDLWCIDPQGTGDVSPVLGHGDRIERNPGDRTVWHFSSIKGPNDANATFANTFHRSLSTPAAKDGLLIVPDLSGQIHCFDAKSGVRHAVHDLRATCWSSPLIVGKRVYVADEDGDVAVFNLSKQLEPVAETTVARSVYGTPTFAHDTLYIADKSTLYAIRLTE